MRDNRPHTEFTLRIKQLYDESTPKQQRELDRKLTQTKAATLASPHGMFHLFPTLGAKTLKTKTPQ